MLFILIEVILSQCFRIQMALKDVIRLIQVPFCSGARPCKLRFLGTNGMSWLSLTNHSAHSGGSGGVSLNVSPSAESALSLRGGNSGG